MLRLLLNPYRIISGITALMIGLLIMVASSILASYNGIHFTGMFSVQMGNPNGMLIPLLESLLNWMFLSVVALILSGIFLRRINKLPELFGWIAFSRSPFLLSASLGFVPGISMDTPYHFENILVGMGMILFGMWSLILLLNAISTALEVNGDRKWIIFIAEIIIAGLSSSYLYKIF